MVNPEDGKTFTIDNMVCVASPTPDPHPDTGGVVISGIMLEGRIGHGHQMLIFKDTSSPNVEKLTKYGDLIAERICGRSAVQMKVR